MILLFPLLPAVIFFALIHASYVKALDTNGEKSIGILRSVHYISEIFLIVFVINTIGMMISSSVVIILIIIAAAILILRNVRRISEQGGNITESIIKTVIVTVLSAAAAHALFSLLFIGLLMIS